MSNVLIPADIPEQNITRSPREPHAEVLDTSSLDVWLCQEPMDRERYKNLKVPAPLVKSGYGRSAFDFAYFLRSPRATGAGGLEVREIDGLRFVRVARPEQLRGFAPGNQPTKLMIEKHHVLGFEAGTVMRLARLPDGQYYLQQTATAGEVPDLDPPDWEMFTLKLERPWSVALSCPAVVWFFRNMRSFTGPFTLEQLPGMPEAAPRAVAA